MEPKYPVTGSHTNEYLVLHALEKGECSIRNIRACISEDTKPVRRWRCLTGKQTGATLQRLARKGLVEHRGCAVNLWQLRHNYCSAAKNDIAPPSNPDQKPRNNAK